MGRYPKEFRRMSVNPTTPAAGLDSRIKVSHLILSTRSLPLGMILAS